MTTIGYSGPLERAWQRMRLILFSPFDLGKWIVLGFTAWLANLLGGFGGAGFKGNLNSENLAHTCRESGSFITGIFDHWYWIVLGAVALVLLVGFILLCLWLSSRAKFVFLDNVVHDRAQVAEPWKRYRDAGNSLFFWRLGFLLVAMLVFVALMGGMAGLSFLARGRITSPAFLLPLGLVVVISAVILAYVNLYLENFVIPIMYGFDLPATEAWQLFLEWWKRNTGPFLVYGLFVLGLSILVGITILVVGFATCCVGFFLMMLPFVGTVLTLPIWVTYRALGVEFLAQMDPRFDLFAAAIAQAAADTNGAKTVLDGDDTGGETPPPPITPGP